LSSCIGLTADQTAVTEPGNRAAAGTGAENNAADAAGTEEKTAAGTEGGTNAETDTEEQTAAVTEGEKAAPPDFGSDIFEAVSVSDDIDIQLKEVCRVYEGDGEDHVKCKKVPGDDYCPSNITFCENGDIIIVDCLGVKAERYSKDGRHVSSTDLRIAERPDSKLTYAVYSKGSIYAVFDQEYIYRFDPEGSPVFLRDEHTPMLEASQVDGRVILFIGSTPFRLTESGDIEEENDFKNASCKQNPDDYRKITEVTFKRDGKKGVYKVDSSFSVNFTGIVNDLLILQKYEKGECFYTAYDHDGTVKFVINEKFKENDLAPEKNAFEYGDKLYILTCGAEYTSVYEITVTEK
ncbi:MAG: hypothetical protein II777_09715, partial [Clostridia bacterium]|nr:hypothetical protein [Clostridia bacterium]